MNRSLGFRDIAAVSAQFQIKMYVCKIENQLCSLK